MMLCSRQSRYSCMAFLLTFGDFSSLKNDLNVLQRFYCNSNPVLNQFCTKELQS